MTRDRTQVLVSGGAGFIGSHLVERLVGAGATVRVLDDFSTGRRHNLAAVEPEVEILAGDLLDPALRRRACAGVDTVFHLAGLTSAPESVERPADFERVNRAGSLALFADAAAAGARRSVFASSAAVYGRNGFGRPVAIEGEEGEPLSPYAAAKAAVERQAPGVVSLRLFNVYGPRQDPRGPYAAVVAACLESARAGRAATVFGDGLQTRDFIHVADVVAAFLAAASAPAARVEGQAFNVGSGRATTILELVGALRRLLPGAPPPVFAPARRGEVRHSRADLEKVRGVLAWAPAVGLEEGLAMMVQGV